MANVRTVVAQYARSYIDRLLKARMLLAESPLDRATAHPRPPHPVPGSVPSRDSDRRPRPRPLHPRAGPPRPVPHGRGGAAPRRPVPPRARPHAPTGTPLARRRRLSPQPSQPSQPSTSFTPSLRPCLRRRLLPRSRTPHSNLPPLRPPRARAPHARPRRRPRAAHTAHAPADARIRGSEPLYLRRKSACPSNSGRSGATPPWAPDAI
ncbi:hypothetical protein DFH09DRAFT_1394456, partial [Mycena vulgaris]